MRLEAEPILPLWGMIRQRVQPSAIPAAREGRSVEVPVNLTIDVGLGHREDVDINLYL